MKENKYSKEYLDNKACELADEQIEGVAGGVLSHPCLECKHYESLQQSILRGFASADDDSLTGKITSPFASADDDSIIRSQRADNDSLTEKLRTGEKESLRIL